MQSQLRYIIGNCQNQVFIVMWWYLLVPYFIRLLDWSHGLYLVFLVYSFKIIVYLLVDTYCSIQHKILMTNSFNKQCDPYIYEIIHKQIHCDIFISTYSQHTCNCTLINDTQRQQLTWKPIREKPQRRSSSGMRNMLAPFVCTLSLQTLL